MAPSSGPAGSDSFLLYDFCPAFLGAMFQQLRKMLIVPAAAAGWRARARHFRLVGLMAIETPISAGQINATIARQMQLETQNGTE